MSITVEQATSTEIPTERDRIKYALVADACGKGCPTSLARVEVHMMNRRRSMSIAMGSLFGGAVLRPHTPLRSTDATSQEALLSEVRALRSEMSQLFNTLIKTQLLVTRLQLQEQRVVMTGRRLTEIQTMLAEIRAEIRRRQPALDALGKEERDLTDPERRRGVQSQIKALTEEVSRFATRSRDLRNQEAELLATLSNEEGRWNEYNERLDAIERGTALK